MLHAEYVSVSKSKSKNEDVNQDEVTKFHDNQFKKYEDNLELDEDTRNRFLESYCQETVDSPEKADRLITFMRQDLKFQDRFYDNSSISIIIFCLKFREDSTVTTEDLFKILKLNQEKNLSLSVLLDCVKKFDIDCDNIETLLSFAKKYEFYAKETENKQEKHNPKYDNQFLSHSLNVKRCTSNDKRFFEGNGLQI